MDIEVIRRISLARYLYELGASNLHTGNDLHLFAGVNLLQDAVEAFLVAVGEHVGAVIEPRADFDKYFTKIDQKRAPPLPFRMALLRLNRIRIDSKHHGIQPARDECERLAVSARQFFEEVTQEVFGTSFSTVSALELLPQGPVREALLEAKIALERGDYKTLAISCRKVLYLEVENFYSIYRFKPGAKIGFLGGLQSCLAPVWAQSVEYIALHVRDPIDYIVLDYDRVNQDLLLRGIPPEDFWNLTRLTPPVFSPRAGEWNVREEFQKLDEKLLADKAEYIFATTVDIAISFSAYLRRIQFAQPGEFMVELPSEGTPIYEKADRDSMAIFSTKEGIREAKATFRVPGLKGDGLYYFVSVTTDEDYVRGFVHESDLQ